MLNKQSFEVEQIKARYLGLKGVLAQASADLDKDPSDFEAWLKEINEKLTKAWVSVTLESSECKIKLSQIVCPNPESTEVLVFPSQAMVDEMLANGVLHNLVGLENNEKDGTGPCWNFILSNGQ